VYARITCASASLASWGEHNERLRHNPLVSTETQKKTFGIRVQDERRPRSGVWGEGTGTGLKTSFQATLWAVAGRAALQALPAHAAESPEQCRLPGRQLRVPLVLLVATQTQAASEGAEDATLAEARVRQSALAD
jgi:hypothetical protein